MNDDARPMIWPNFATWRFLALGACLLAMFFPIIRAIVLWAGSDALFSYPSPYPSVWVAAFLFGVLVGRMEVIFISALGAAVAVVVSVGVDSINIGGRPDETFAFNFYGLGSDLAATLTQLVIPWVWVAVFAGLGALVSTRISELLGLPKA
jgi:hypothetical protein